MKLLLWLSKEWPATLMSHLDCMRALERGMRAAGLPLAYTEGYHPHPRISFAAPLALGVIGEREPVEVELMSAVEVEDIPSALSRRLPTGLVVTDVSEAVGFGALPSRVVALDYFVCMPGVSETETRCLADDVLASSSLVIERNLPKGSKSRDIRPFLVDVKGVRDGVLVRSLVSSTGTVHPTELRKLLASAGGEEWPSVRRLCVHVIQDPRLPRATLPTLLSKHGCGSRKHESQDESPA